MTSTTLQLIPNEELISLKAEIKEIKDILKKKPEELFQLHWVESTKIPPLLGISRRTWQSWRDKRIIPYSQFGSKIYVRLSDINAHLEKHLSTNLKSF